MDCFISHRCCKKSGNNLRINQAFTHCVMIFIEKSKQLRIFPCIYHLYICTETEDAGNNRIYAHSRMYTLLLYGIRLYNSQTNNFSFRGIERNLRQTIDAVCRSFHRYVCGEAQVEKLIFNNIIWQ
jgi:hypothetical protein